jgi:hypothetical protein
LLDADDVPTPTAFAATTVKVYAVPGSMPLAVHDVPVGGQLMPAGDERTEYDVIGEPPLEGAAQLTVAPAPTIVAVTAVGAPGAIAGTNIGRDGDESALPL